MGAFAAVAQGSEQEPALITIAYEGPGAQEPTLGFVGKAVTFDSGGISLKPGAKMAEMKFDMSGGAAVIEAIAAIARLQLPVQRPRRGRRDREPAERPRDQAGRHRDGVQRQDDRGQQHRCRGPAGARRLPLPRDRRGRRADRRPRDADRRGDRRPRVDLRGPDQQRRRARRAGHRLRARRRARSSGACRCTRSTPSCSRANTPIWTTRPKRARRARSWAATSSSNFVGDTPWAHLDIAGSAWDLGRPYVGKGASGYGVRLLVELAQLLLRADSRRSRVGEPGGRERLSPMATAAARVDVARDGGRRARDLDSSTSPPAAAAARS